MVTSALYIKLLGKLDIHTGRKKKKSTPISHHSQKSILGGLQI